ncbi:MAG: folate-binding protein YgfZ [Methyloprofundus sp.]|nr:folate-binding protein YgfZ [Methyloprofundus sp.]
MHADWITYLNTQTLVDQLPTNDQAIIAPLSHLAVLLVSGKEAATFLQGQTTCDIKALIDSEPRLGAYCNAKGRTISTFIVIKLQETYQLILTKDLLDSVRKKLQMYVLRADVQLTDLSDQLCIIGMHNVELTAQMNLYPYPQQDNSYLFIAEPSQAQIFCTELQEKHTAQFVAADTWLGLDIQAGIPWLFPETTEKFVPQMLNLDKLDAISFTKGCYTGQEIVARTHYLGQNKRAMYRASGTTEGVINKGCSISDSNNPEAELGAVILSTRHDNSAQLLLVLKDQALQAKNLQLNNQNHDKIILE